MATTYLDEVTDRVNELRNLGYTISKASTYDYSQIPDARLQDLRKEVDQAIQQIRARIQKVEKELETVRQGQAALTLSGLAPTDIQVDQADRKKEIAELKRELTIVEALHNNKTLFTPWYDKNVGLRVKHAAYAALVAVAGLALRSYCTQ